ncbi:uncharacterized protein PHACADRAFT_261962 [Phanerochaete carnosa HHB-10118-sp]|uniref:FAD-binding FR-type domain-containing protein n=1 Tax=Phanerochaete carnosa (strain HHB-10118-sp) TaxID=650164 RepID=K5WMX0_PHACS|nr:uncharacterized protein PHACADRAFT_261962 [Phanerochaete carnosa HHB-10118-sp]EKM51677.1 hypothetical protein PHACADRAFT_261962 [Phanerochaete carnosa HHB-10118-sp]
MPILGWHRGERIIQERLGFGASMSNNYTWIRDFMPDQHREFHSTRLPFIPVTTLDDRGRPWTSIWAGKAGEPGFVNSSSPNHMDMEIKVWEGDPFWDNHTLFNGEKLLAAGIGIEFSTRRRNKFAGHVYAMQKDNNVFQLKLIVNEAIGNCPKYINIRTLDPYPDTLPVIVHKCDNLPEDGRLPDELVEFVRECDTIFIGSSYEASPEEAKMFPSHVGANQRGGRPGWVRMRSDGRTVVIPDYSGNRVLSSLGNIEVTPVASVTIVDFATGDTLYITGKAHTAVGQEAQAIMPRQGVITLLEVTGYRFVRDALPVRQRPGTEPERSPYSPPVRLLAEEMANGSKFFEEEVSVTLTRVRVHSADLATFTWETSKPLNIRPGQTAVLDFSDLVGKAGYQHMADLKPSAVNDDRVRTWTISSAHLAPEGTKTFDLTMREIPNGTITGALFATVRKLQELRPEILDDARQIGLTVKLVGISGDFYLGLPPTPGAPLPEDSNEKMLWLAGGIGLTPFLSMLNAIAHAAASDAHWDVVLVVATREPEVLLPLIAESLGTGTENLRLAIHVYSSSRPAPDFPQPAPKDGLEITCDVHPGRIPESFFASMEDLTSRKTYMCGPGPFELGMSDMLGKHGVTSIVRESFQY